MYYNDENSYLLVNGIETYAYKAKYSEIVAPLLWPRYISKDWTVDKMKWINEYVFDFSTDYDTILVDDILDIQKYLMKKNKMI